MNAHWGGGVDSDEPDEEECEIRGNEDEDEDVDIEPCFDVKREFLSNIHQGCFAGWQDKS